MTSCYRLGLLEHEIEDADNDDDDYIFDDNNYHDHVDALKILMMMSLMLPLITLNSIT